MQSTIFQVYFVTFTSTVLFRNDAFKRWTQKADTKAKHCNANASREEAICMFTFLFFSSFYERYADLHFDRLFLFLQSYGIYIRTH